MTRTIEPAIDEALQRARSAVPYLAWKIDPPEGDALPELVGSAETTGVDVHACAVRAVTAGRIVGGFMCGIFRGSPVESE